MQKPQLHKQHETTKAVEKKQDPSPLAKSVDAESHEEEEPEENDDDEYFEVDETRHILHLPMHFGGNFHHILPEPEHHHFSPMSNNQKHPYFAARQNRAADDFLDAKDFYYLQ